MKRYILGIDQSTQATKALLFDEYGQLISRADLPHRQIIDENGWVEHDPTEIYSNVLKAVRNVVAQSGIDKSEIVGIGISNQRETSVAWTKKGKPICNAIVWQCSRGRDICERVSKEGYGTLIQERTGIRLSPYFPAAKISWIMENVKDASKLSQISELYFGTIDTYLIYCLTNGKEYRTDYSNASRTQYFDIHKLMWDRELCDIWRIPFNNLPILTASDGYFGETDFGGYLEKPIPIHAVLGDSHGALFGQGCLEYGMAKATYGTGSSIMMNVGKNAISSNNGLVSSIAWYMNDRVEYVLEGNINYSGATVSWLKDSLGLIRSAEEAEDLALQASENDHTYIIPAFTGLGAPYWDSDASALIYGMSRTTQRAEIVKAALESIAYQITDIVKLMEEDAKIKLKELRVDGGPTHNAYLMQFQSDILGKSVNISKIEELSGMGVAYAAGIGLGFYDKDLLFKERRCIVKSPIMSQRIAEKKYSGWKTALRKALSH